MLKLNPKNAALAALVTAGLAGATLVPAYAQSYNNSDDRNYNGYRAHRVVTHRYHPSAWHRDWIGVGTPGYGVGFYTNSYHHYCRHWDPTYGYCWF